MCFNNIISFVLFHPYNIITDILILFDRIFVIVYYGLLYSLYRLMNYSDELLAKLILLNLFLFLWCTMWCGFIFGSDFY